jgi:hypothetical protein
VIIESNDDCRLIAVAMATAAMKDDHESLVVATTDAYAQRPEDMLNAALSVIAILTTAYAGSMGLHEDEALATLADQFIEGRAVPGHQ